MLRRSWKPVVGGAVLVGASSYLYFRLAKQPKAPTFDLSVRVRGPDGKPMVTKRTLPLISKQEVEQRLNEHALSTNSKRPNGIVWKQTTAFLAANDPIEDANASAIIERSATELSPAGDLLFFAVMDGHAGFYTSRLMSKVLIPAVAMELDTLIKDPASSIPDQSTLQTLKASLFPTTDATIPLIADPKRVSAAIQNAFVNLDYELVSAPLKVLMQALPEGKLGKGQPVPDLSSHPMALASMVPALSGILWHYRCASF